jgi:hypothetical protein
MRSSEDGRNPNAATILRRSSATKWQTVSTVDFDYANGAEPNRGTSRTNFTKPQAAIQIALCKLLLCEE